MFLQIDGTGYMYSLEDGMYVANLNKKLSLPTNKKETINTLFKFSVN